MNEDKIIDINSSENEIEEYYNDIERRMESWDKFRIPEINFRDTEIIKQLKIISAQLSKIGYQLENITKILKKR